jgi:indole-3-glycerol phosphate synthase
MKNILDQICNDKKAHVETKKATTSEAQLLQLINNTPPPRDFYKALQTKKENGEPALIAELKKASPSKGLIRSDFDPSRIAKSYKEGGATCLSVLTDEPYFQGHDTYIQRAKENVDLPVLRKDFMIDPYQVVESRALNADCILLIMAALDDARVYDLYQTAYDLKMDVLIEVHDAGELKRALKIHPHIIGINSRNLKTLEVDIQVTYNLLNELPATCIRVAESGIYDHDTLLSLQTSGADAFLVGESLMRQPDVAFATHTLLGTN